MFYLFAGISKHDKEKNITREEVGKAESEQDSGKMERNTFPEESLYFLDQSICEKGVETIENIWDEVDRLIIEVYYPKQQ